MNVFIPIELAKQFINQIGGLSDLQIHEILQKAINTEENIAYTTKRLCEKLEKANINTEAYNKLGEALDNEVHEIASKAASSVNNQGFHDQIEYLVRELGEDEVERLLNTVISFVSTE